MWKRIWHLYYDGFRQMPRWGRILWIIVIAKLLVMFIVFKLILMPNYLNHNYTTDEEKSDHVLNELSPRAFHSSRDTLRQEIQ